MPKCVPGRLLVTYSRKAQKGRVGYCEPAKEEDAFLIARIFRREPPKKGEKSLREELEERGYDLTTLRFSIDKKKI